MWESHGTNTDKQRKQMNGYFNSYDCLFLYMYYVLPTHNSYCLFYSFSTY